MFQLIDGDPLGECGESVVCGLEMAPLLRGVLLVASAAPAAAFCRPSSPLVTIDLGGGKSVRVVKAWPLWPSSIGLARVVAHCPSLVRGKRVLSLGCGLGAVGIAAAHAGASAVLNTDTDEEYLECAAVAASATGLNTISTARLDWATPGESVLKISDEPYDLILSADILYDENDVVEVAELLDQLLVTSSACCLIADPIGRERRPDFKAACATVGLSVTDGSLPTPPGETGGRAVSNPRPTPTPARASEHRLRVSWRRRAAAHMTQTAFAFESRVANRSTAPISYAREEDVLIALSPRRWSWALPCRGGWDRFGTRGVRLCRAVHRDSGLRLESLAGALRHSPARALVACQPASPPRHLDAIISRIAAVVARSPLCCAVAACWRRALG